MTFGRTCRGWAFVVAGLTLAPPLAAQWTRTAVLYEVNVRDFSSSGNFRGVIAGLGRIQAAGANVLWLMPIYPIGELHRKGPLGSPYSVRDYHGINPDYGTAADLHALVRAVHARGMHLILDWVPNHTSWDNVWATQHPGFYVRDAKGGLTVPRDDKGNLTDWTDVAQLDYGNADLRAAMISAMSFWLTTFDVDGFRVDAAGFVPDAFWREAVPAVRASVARPILLLAEWGDTKMNRFGFDLTYSWDSYGKLKASWKDAPADRYVTGVIGDLDSMPPGGERLRFTTNHDETASDHPPIVLFGGERGARAAFIAAALMPGRPLLYDGQEIESPQQIGLFDREPIDWNQPHAAAATRFYRRIVTLTRSEPFVSDSLRAITTSNPDTVMAFARGSAIVLINARNAPVRFAVANPAIAGLTDILSGVRQRSDTVALGAYGTLVLEPARPAAPH